MPIMPQPNLPKPTTPTLPNPACPPRDHDTPLEVFLGGTLPTSEGCGVALDCLSVPCRGLFQSLQPVLLQDGTGICLVLVYLEMGHLVGLPQCIVNHN